MVLGRLRDCTVPVLSGERVRHACGTDPVACLFPEARVLSPSGVRTKKGGNMATYFMFGKYSSEAINAVSASRSKQAEELVKSLEPYYL